MSNRTATANGADPIQQKAASDAKAVQDGVNLVAIVGCFHRHLLALNRSGVCRDDLNNHPVSLAFVSKLSSLCRMNFDREMAAFEADSHRTSFCSIAGKVCWLWKTFLRPPDVTFRRAKLRHFPVAGATPCRIIIY